MHSAKSRFAALFCVLLERKPEICILMSTATIMDEKLMMSNTCMSEFRSSIRV